MKTIKPDDLKIIMHHLKEIMDENRDYLVKLDGVMGDSDLGLTMAKAFSAGDETIQALDETSPGKMLIKVGMSMAKAAPSTMGTLLATGFMRGGKAVAEAAEISTLELTEFFNAFVNGIMERGKAQPGEKTIIDSLYPAVQALQQAVSDGLMLEQAVVLAYSAAQEGLEKATGMKAQHGRAAYYQEKSIGIQDPGATVGVLMLKGFVEVIGTCSGMHFS